MSERSAGRETIPGAEGPEIGEDVETAAKTDPHIDASRKPKLWKYQNRNGLTANGIFYKNLKDRGKISLPGTGRLKKSVSLSRTSASVNRY